jgi:dihydrofolate synthase/folylpolyglutamate synthase
MKNYDTNDALDWLNSRIMFGVKAGLDNISEVLLRLNQPQLKFKSVHVAGSNGKGSTASLLAKMLSDFGVKTALFSSPHLVHVRERIQINQQAISESDLNRILILVKDACRDDIPITFFEVMTAVGFYYFAEQNVDWVILEVGLGGRLDATNIVDSQCQILTGISLEHTQWLGDTLEKILYEKLGVTRSGKPLFASVVSELFEPLFVYCQERQIRLHLKTDREEFFEELIPVRYQGGFRQNAYLALSVLVDFFEFTDFDQIQKSLSEHSWPARYQKLSAPDLPLIILDGAHNPEGMDHLVALLEKEKYSDLHFVMGVVQDKDAQNMFLNFAHLAKDLILTRGQNTRFVNPHDLLDFVPQEVLVRVESDLSSLWTEVLSKPNEIFVICGSLYLMGDVIEFLSDYYPQLENFKAMKSSPNEGSFRGQTEVVQRESV